MDPMADQPKSARLGPGSAVLHVCAGTCAITTARLGAGARVDAVEARPGRAQCLRERLDERVVVVRAEAAELRLPGRPYHVVANPPFHVTAALLRRLVQPVSRMVSARLILQHQAAV